MKKTLHIVIVLFVVDILVIGLLYWGNTIMVGKKAEETAVLQSSRDETDRAAKLTDLRRTLQTAEKQREIFTKNLFDPTEENQIRFLSEMEQLGTSTSGALVETQTLSLTPSPRALHGEFSIKGTWKQVFHTLRLIEEYPARIVINRFSVSRTSAGTATALEIWDANISLDMINLKP